MDRPIASLATATLSALSDTTLAVIVHIHCILNFAFTKPFNTHYRCLGNQGRGRGSFILPHRRQLASALVVAGQAVDAGLDENHAVLAVLVLAVALQVLAHRDGLFDQVVQVFGDFRGQTYRE